MYGSNATLLWWGCCAQPGVLISRMEKPKKKKAFGSGRTTLLLEKRVSPIKRGKKSATVCRSQAESQQLAKSRKGGRSYR